MKNKKQLIMAFRTIAESVFSFDKSEAELNDTYTELREEIVCAMADRAEELGIDPDTL